MCVYVIVHMCWYSSVWDELLPMCVLVFICKCVFFVVDLCVGSRQYSIEVSMWVFGHFVLHLHLAYVFIAYMCALAIYGCTCTVEQVGACVFMCVWCYSSAVCASFYKYVQCCIIVSIDGCMDVFVCLRWGGGDNTV